MIRAPRCAGAKTIAEMKTEAEFAEFSETPGIFRQVAVSNPTDPRAALRRVQKTIAAMKTEPEFAEFSETPGFSGKLP